MVEVLHAIGDQVAQGVNRSASILLDETDEALLTKQIAVRMASIGNPIGIQNQLIVFLHLERLLLEPSIGEDTQKEALRRDHVDLTASGRPMQQLFVAGLA